MIARQLDKLFPRLIDTNGALIACSTPGCRHYARHRHHIVYRSQGGADTPDNLRALCHSCHTKLHSEAGNYADWGRKGGKATAAKMVSMPNLKQFQGAAGAARWEAYLARKTALQIGIQ